MRAPFGIVIAGLLAAACSAPCRCQTTPANPARVRDFGIHRRDAPRLQRVRRYGAYEVVFPRTHLRPLRLNEPASHALQDRLPLAPHRLVRIANPTHVIDDTGPESSLLVNGRKQHIAFDKFLTNPKWWTRERWYGAAIGKYPYLAIKVELERGSLSADSYWLFGLAKAHGKVYLGLSWYDPRQMGMGGQGNVVGMVFRLDRQGRRVVPRPVRSLDDLGIVVNMPPPILDTLPDGDLLLRAGSDFWRMDRKGGWHRLKLRSPERYPQLAGYTSFWRRGRWIVAGKFDYHGAEEVDLMVYDARTRQRVRQFRWSFW